MFVIVPSPIILWNSPVVLRPCFLLTFCNFEPFLLLVADQTQVPVLVKGGGEGGRLCARPPHQNEVPRSVMRLE